MENEDTEPVYTFFILITRDEHLGYLSLLQQCKIRTRKFLKVFDFYSLQALVLII